MPLVAVNTGALPEGTFESELFGHVKGAFTDARTDRIGRFELADNGTIFLDEIGNVPMRQQAKLLRVLETGEIERVGSSRTKHIECARDLRYQLQPAGCHRRRTLPRRPAVPPEHRRDSYTRRCASGAKIFPLLAAHFLKRYATRYRAAVSGFAACRLAGDDAVCVARQCARVGAHAGARCADVPAARFRCPTWA